MTEDKSISVAPQTCTAHDYDVMKPVVLATWKHGFQGACPDKSAILAESQVNNCLFFSKYKNAMRKKNKKGRNK